MIKTFLFFLLLMTSPPLTGIGQLTSCRFDFGSGKVKKGFVSVTTSSVYTKTKGFGFLTTEGLRDHDYYGPDPLTTDFITNDQPFYFTVDVPEGHYRVIVYLGDEQGTSSAMVRTECRRLMLEKVSTERGKIVVREFTVHVRNKYIAGTSDSVRLKGREFNYFHWDNQLTLEFTGRDPKVCGVEIVSTEKPVTVFLAGNSTVVDQAEEPYAAWGQMIPVFFKPEKIVIANYAESGETLKSFRHEKRLEKVFSLMKPGDYLFIEFAHNDQKPGANHLDPYTTYKETLKYFIDETRKRKGIPVLVTSMHRRKFDDQDKIVNTLDNYPEAVRQTGVEEKVPVIDLNAMSKILYEAWGREKSKQAFVHYPAGTFPGQDKDLEDNTHFNPYGAYELAKCVVEGIKSNHLAIANALLDNLPSFDPAHPDPVETWYWPRSTQRKNGTELNGN
jgi:lysophospholipase L1-like esterase